MLKNKLLSAMGGAPANYIEDVFSTYLYTGNGSTQTITNGIDLSTNGGLVWTKSRNAGYDHELYDTARGINKVLISNSTAASANAPSSLTAFNTTGFTLGANNNSNSTGITGVSWTFRKQPKFFDVVTYTGNGVSGRQIPHSLGSVPGCMIVKGTSIAENWTVYHRSQGATKFGLLDQTDAFATSNDRWNDTTPTSTVFTVGNAAKVNASGETYVAYLFAHDAGGFGLTGTDNVISCGTFNGADADVPVALGYEPQWLMVKRTDAAGTWRMFDNMRGMTADGKTAMLYANASDAEIATNANVYTPTATGFIAGSNIVTGTYIYIAIRRGPMKVPTDGTKVFIPVTQTDGGTVTTNFPVDLTINGDRSSWVPNWFDRLRGGSSNTYAILNSASTNAEAAGSGTGSMGFQNNTGYRDYWNNSGLSAIYWSFQRAPGFFDEVCYTGNGSTQTITHNLTVVPELIIAKNRGQAGNNWPVLFNFASTTMNYGFLNLTNSCPNDTYANVGVFSAAPTSTSMFLTNSGSMNGSGYGIVAYLFATCPGVSKVGSYTGTATTLQINCGFTTGARFVLIKRTDSTGDWYVWDSARGIVAGNDPYLLLNSTAAEVTSTDYVDTYSAGFELTSTAPAALNASGGTYIFLAIA